ncbi:hypothetical protein [Paenirhodobacter hankyongi]|uniref:DUF1217 domain-containing protein n=1 Tax=Paenirhodobacter hankyongi TaxID=2294033 RepID=A0A421BNA1_9RHOB|nr:hypothetical protein [Sinirhodobacter hankyongi]RLL64563.1 hypothetical protein DYS74_11315 [Sinirhodobacter hankyongi]
MKRNMTYAAVALVLSAGVASAAETNQGLQQIANYLGVDAGAYSATELHQLLGARDAGDQSTYDYFLNRVGAAQGDAVTAGKAQIAAQVGLNPAEYTTAELIRVQKAQRQGDLQTVTFVVSHQNRNTIVNPQVAMGRDS